MNDWTKEGMNEEKKEIYKNWMNEWMNESDRSGLIDNNDFPVNPNMWYQSYFNHLISSLSLFKP